MEIKGTCVMSVLAFLKERKVHDEVIAGLPEEHRKTFSGLILPAAWYPVESYLVLLDQIAVVRSGNAEDFVNKIGRRIINDGLNSFYRVFLKIGNPHFILKQSPQLWGKYFKGSTLNVVRAEKGMGKVLVNEAGKTSRWYCLTKAAGMQEALELSGARNVLVSHPKCRARGAGICEFELTWDA